MWPTLLANALGEHWAPGTLPALATHLLQPVTSVATPGRRRLMIPLGEVAPLATLLSWLFLAN